MPHGLMKKKNEWNDLFRNTSSTHTEKKSERKRDLIIDKLEEDVYFLCDHSVEPMAL